MVSLRKDLGVNVARQLVGTIVSFRELLGVDVAPQLVGATVCSEPGGEGWVVLAVEVLEGGGRGGTGDRVDGNEGGEDGLREFHGGRGRAASVGVAVVGRCDLCFVIVVHAASVSAVIAVKAVSALMVCMKRGVKFSTSQTIMSH